MLSTQLTKGLSSTLADALADDILNARQKLIEAKKYLFSTDILLESIMYRNPSLLLKENFDALVKLSPHALGKLEASLYSRDNLSQPDLDDLISYAILVLVTTMFQSRQDAFTALAADGKQTDVGSHALTRRSH